MQPETAPPSSALALAGRRMRLPAEPDAELLRLGSLFERAWAIERDLNALLDAAPENEWPGYEGLLDAASLNAKAIAERILEQRAASLPGLLVKARIASWCHSGRPIERDWLTECGIPEGETLTVDGKSVLSILRDLEGLAAQPLPTTPAATPEAA